MRDGQAGQVIDRRVARAPHLKIRSAGIGVDLKWSMCRAQETRNLTGELHHVVHDMRQRDKCRQSGTLAHGRAQIAP